MNVIYIENKNSTLYLALPLSFQLTGSSNMFINVHLAIMKNKQKCNAYQYLLKLFLKDNNKKETSSFRMPCFFSKCSYKTTMKTRP